MATKAYPESAGRAFGYCRVSSDQQADSGVSIDEQQTKITTRCTENGWRLEQVFIDAGVSGATPLAKRPQGRLLVDALRSGDIVIASRTDRMFWSSVDALNTITRFKARRISLWLLDLGDDVAGDGILQLVTGILDAVTEFERSLISEPIKDSKRQLRRAHHHLGGRRPFGWNLGEADEFGWNLGEADDDGRAHRLVADPAEQEAIATIRKLRAAGGTLMAIRDAMRQRGHQISHETVRAILNSTA